MCDSRVIRVTDKLKHVGVRYLKTPIGNPQRGSREKKSEEKERKKKKKKEEKKKDRETETEIRRLIRTAAALQREREGTRTRKLFNTEG